MSEEDHQWSDLDPGWCRTHARYCEADLDAEWLGDEDRA